MTVLVTSEAGFIGMHVAKKLLARGDTIVGVVNLTTTMHTRWKINIKTVRSWQYHNIGPRWQVITRDLFGIS